MAEIDLRALSAPILALKGEVQSAYQRLDAKWDLIVGTLRELAIPVRVSYTIWESASGSEWSALEFKKHNGAKRICFTSYQLPSEGVDETTSPYEEWGVERRIAMLRFVPKLFEAAARATKDFIEQTKVNDFNSLELV